MASDMIKDYSDSERRNTLLPYGLLFPIRGKSSFICIIPDRITHTMASVTHVMEHWLEQEISLWVHHEGLIWRPITPWVGALSRTYISLPTIESSPLTYAPNDSIYRIKSFYLENCLMFINFQFCPGIHWKQNWFLKNNI